MQLLQILQQLRQIKKFNIQWFGNELGMVFVLIFQTPKQPQCPSDKEEVIIEALKHFQC